ncbi:MAG: hypothetical protein U0169_13685 [Polyangiaceae bacterium]
MRTLSSRTLARFGVVLVPTVLALVATGCGDTLVDVDGDASLGDASIPDAVATDARGDTGTVDAGRDASADARTDGTLTDASDASDARTDGDASADGGRDATLDSGTDAADGSSDAADAATNSDASDAGDATDAGLEPAPAQADFIVTVANRLCQWRSRCCFGGEASARFDLPSCEAFESSPVLGGSLGVGFYKDLSVSPNVTYDATRAATCINAVNQLSCGQIRGQDLFTLIHTCYTAIVGTIPQGSAGCADSIECQSTSYCGSDGDGGSTCKPVRPVDGMCPTADHANGIGFEQEICSYLGTGVSNDAWCDRANDGGTCARRLDDGEVCRSGQQCKSRRCVQTNVPNERRCDEFWPLLTPGTTQCTQFEIKDAGTD